MSEARGVVQLLCGASGHALHLAVCLYSMRSRNAWTGPVTLLCGDQDAQHVCEWLSERFVGVGWQRFEHNMRRAGAYVSKTRIHELTPYDETIFLDADMVLTSRPGLEELFPKDGEFVTTSFGDWTNRGRLTRGRVLQWKQLAPDAVEEALSVERPSINTGSFGFCRYTEFCKPWHELTKKRQVFITDESCCNALIWRYPHRILNDAWNCSARYGVNKETAVVYHLHGRSSVRHKDGRGVWMPVFQEALSHVSGLESLAERCDPAALQWLGRWCNGE